MTSGKRKSACYPVGYRGATGNQPCVRSESRARCPPKSSEMAISLFGAKIPCSGAEQGIVRNSPVTV